MATTYTTNQETRDEAGFTYNTDITDAQIEAARVRAFSTINSKIWQRYKLPITDNTCYDSSPAKGMLNNIELLLASWYLLITEYGNESVGTDKDGYKKRDLALQMIDEIVQKTLLLLCDDGTALDPNSELWETTPVKNSIWGFPSTDENRIFNVWQRF